MHLAEFGSGDENILKVALQNAFPAAISGDHPDVIFQRCMEDLLSGVGPDKKVRIGNVYRDLYEKVKKCMSGKTF